VTLDMTFTDATPMAAVHAQHHNDLSAAVKNLQSNLGNAVLTGVWRWTSSTTDAAQSGRVGLNQATWGGATQLNISETTQPGGDATNALANLKVGDGFYVQAQNDATRWAKYTINGTPVDQGTWRAFPVSYLDGGGQPPANNDDTSVSLLTAGGSTASLAAKVDKDSVTAAATRVIQNMLAAGDTQPAWRVMGDGQMNWGAGGTTAPDTTLSRGTAGVLNVGLTTQRGQLRVYGGAVGDTAYEVRVTADTAARWYARADGALWWGPGNAAQDTVLLRGAAGQLNIGGTTIKTGLRIFGAATTDLLIDHRVTTDAQARFYARADGYMAWGPGNVTQDTTLYRSAADRLKTDDLFDATTLAVATKVKAGTPADTDWMVAPPDGTIVADSTGNKLWVRVGGVWKGAVVA
jgi:hypothetical protein